MSEYTEEYLNGLGRRRAPYEDICDELGIPKKNRKTIKSMKEAILGYDGTVENNTDIEEEDTGLKYTKKYLNGLGRRRKSYEQICDELGIPKSDRKTINMMKEAILESEANIEVDIDADIEEINNIAMDTLTYNEEKAAIKKIIDSCLNILRSETIVGYKALVNISKILLLKLIEPHLDYLEIDETIDNIDTKFKDSAKRVVRWSQMMELSEVSWRYALVSLWRFILSEHEKLKDIYTNDDPLSIKEHHNFIRIVRLIDKINIENTDALGDIYENMIKNSSQSKTLGQFFTPHDLKQWIIGLVEPQPEQLIYDPCAGTAGFLTLAYRYIKNNFDMDDIHHYIGGREPESNTYQLAFINCLMSTGNILNIEKGDSLRQITEVDTYDLILTNPPFALKGTYDTFLHDDMKKYIPIVLNNCTLIFLQLFISCLKIGGKCAAIFPDGQEFFSTTKDSMPNVRKLLFKTCNVHGVYAIPSRTFETTGTKTLLIYFTKINNIEDVLEYSDTGKNRTYTWKDIWATAELPFFDWSLDLSYDAEPLVVATIEQLIKKSFRLTAKLYFPKEIISYKNNIDIVKLGNICEVSIGGTPSSKNSSYWNGDNIWISIKDMNKKYLYDSIKKITKSGIKNSSTKLVKKGSLLFSFKLTIGKTSFAGTDLFTNEAIASLVNFTENANKEFIYYALKLKFYYTEDDGGNCMGLCLNKEGVKNLEIPLPPLEIQNKIIEQLTICEDQIENTKKYIDVLKQSAKLYINQYVEDFDKVIIGDVCKIKRGDNVAKKDTTPGDFPVYGGGEFTYFMNKYNREGITCKIGVSGVSLNNCVKIIKGKYFLITSGCTITSDTQVDKYIWYYLLNNRDLVFQNCNGSAQLNLQVPEFLKAEIPLPPLEIQTEIVEYLDKLYDQVDLYEDQLDKIKIHMKDILNLYLR